MDNEEKIEKALAKSKELREQQQQEKLQSQMAPKSNDANETTKRTDDEKHILDAEQTPTIEPKVRGNLQSK